MSRNGTDARLLDDRDRLKDDLARGLAEFNAVQTRLEEERRSADKILAIVLKSVGDPGVEPAIPAEWKTIAVVEGLAHASTGFLPTSPERSVAAARMALAVADALDDSYPPVLLRAVMSNALCVLGHALRETGSPIASLAMFGRARSIVLRYPLSLDAAFVNLGCAQTLLALRLLTEASANARRARHTFRSLGLRDRVTQCDQILAEIHEASGTVPPDPLRGLSRFARLRRIVRNRE